MKDESGLSPKNEPRWYKYLNPLFSETNEDIELAAKSADVSCMDNFGEDPGNESYPESEASNFCDYEGSDFSASLSSKLKLIKKKLRSTAAPSESEGEHNGVEIKSTSKKHQTLEKLLLHHIKKEKRFAPSSRSSVNLLLVLIKLHQYK